MADMLDGLDALLEEVDAGRPGALNPRAPSYPSSLPYPKPRRPQGPIQPGCTPEEDDGGEVQARFLAYNQEGCVVSKSVDGQNYIEVGAVCVCVGGGGVFCGGKKSPACFTVGCQTMPHVQHVASCIGSIG